VFFLFLCFLVFKTCDFFIFNIFSFPFLCLSKYLLNIFERLRMRVLSTWFLLHFLSKNSKKNGCWTMIQVTKLWLHRTEMCTVQDL